MTESGTGFNLTVKMKDKKYNNNSNFYEMYVNIMVQHSYNFLLQRILL